MGKLPQNRHRALACIAALLGVCAVPSVARADTPKRVAVMVVATVNASPKDASDAIGGLSKTLAKELAVEVVANQDVGKDLTGGRLSDLCFADAKCLRKVGSSLGVDRLVVIAVVRIGAQLKLDSTVVEVATGAAKQRPPIRVAEGQSYESSLKGVGRMLLPTARSAPDPAAKPTPIPKPIKPPTVPVSKPPPPRVVLLREAPLKRRMTRGAWIATGVGAVTFVAGTALGWRAIRGEDDLTSRGCAMMTCPQADIDAVDRDALLADLLLGASVASGVTALVLYLRSGSREPPVQVQATSSSVLFTARGSF